MIRWTRSARIAHGKFMEAIQWAKEIPEFINKKYGSQVTVYLDSFGEFGTIRWFADYADLAALEKLNHQLMTDPEYLKRVMEGTDLVMPGSVFDTVMRSI
jgi:NIPSNAP